MLARFSQGLAMDTPVDYMNMGNLNYGLGGPADRLNEANLFSGLQPPFTTQYGAGAYNQPNMFDVRPNDPLNLMTSVPVTNPYAPGLTVQTPKALLPIAPAHPATNDFKLT